MVYNGYELLGERSYSKEVAMDTVNFVIRSKVFYLRAFARQLWLFRLACVSLRGALYTAGGGGEKKKVC